MRRQATLSFNFTLFGGLICVLDWYVLQTPFSVLIHKMLGVFKHLTVEMFPLASRYSFESQLTVPA